MPFLRLGFLFFFALGAMAAEPKTWQETLAALRKVKSVDEATALFGGRRADARRFLAQVSPTELMQLHDSYIFPVVLLASPLEAGANFMRAMPQWDHGRWRNLEAAAFFARQRRELSAKRWYERGLLAGSPYFDGFNTTRYQAAMQTLATAVEHVSRRGDPISDTLISQIHANLDLLFQKMKPSESSAVTYEEPTLKATAPQLLNLIRRIFELVEKVPMENPEMHQRLLNDLDRRLGILAADRRLSREEDWNLRVGRLRARVRKEKDAMNEGMPERGGLLIGGPDAVAEGERAPRITVQRLTGDLAKRTSLRIHDDGEKMIEELEFHLPEKYAAVVEGVAKPRVGDLLGEMLAEGIWISFPSIDKDHYLHYALADLPESFDLNKVHGAEVWLKPWQKGSLAATFAADELPGGLLTRETIAAAVQARRAADIIPPPVRLSLARRAGLTCRRAARYLFGEWR